MIIFRYLTKEVVVTMLVLICILMLIFLSNQFVMYIKRAAAGQLPLDLVLRLLMMEIPNIIALLLPLGLFISLLVAYGRLYADSEMVVLAACGFSQNRLLMVTMVLGSVVAFIVAILVLFINPIISKQRDYLITTIGATSMLKAVSPGKFERIGGNRALYVEGKSRRQTQVENVFLAEAAKGTNGQHWDILVAENAYVEQRGREEFIVLENGYQYAGTPGDEDFRIVKFGSYQARLPQQEPYLKRIEQAMPISQLFPINNPDLAKAAEIQWRLSAPLMAIILALLAVPMSRVQPRQGKYAKILPSIIIYIIYANMIFVGRDWIANNKISTLIGIWWLHGVVILLALALLFLPHWQRRWRVFRKSRYV